MIQEIKIPSRSFADVSLEDIAISDHLLIVIGLIMCTMDDLLVRI